MIFNNHIGHPTTRDNSDAHDTGRKEVRMHLENSITTAEVDPMLRLSLQFFAEGGGGAGAGDGGDAGGSEASPAGTEAKEPSGSASTSADGAKDGGKTYTAEDAAAVAKQFKMIPHKAVKDRYSSTFAKAEKYDAISEHLGAVAEKYGVSMDDPEGLARAILSDSAIVKTKAAEMGVSEEVARNIVEADVRNAMNKAKETVRVQREEFDRMKAEEAEVKEAYPNFEYESVSKNKAFKALVDSGVSMKEAYEMAYSRQLSQAALPGLKEQIKEELRAEMNAAAARPHEGAAGRRTGNAPDDPAGLKGAELDKFLESFLSR